MKKSFLIIFLLLTGVLSAQPSQWSEQVSGVTTTLTSVYTVNTTNAWVCGYSGTVLKTSNGGVNWVNVSGNGIPATVSLICISGYQTSTTDAIVTGYLGTDTWVWRTTNGGSNWTQVFSQPGGFINAVSMYSATNGFMMGDPVGARWSLWKTTNGGANWDSTGLYLPQTGSDAGWNNSMIYSPPNIWFGTNNTRIYYSTNNGANFTVIATPGEVNSYAIWNNTPISGLGLFGGANIYQTTNYGTNWTYLPALGAGNFGGITSTPLIITDNLLFQLIWYVRTTNTIYTSTNFGVNWTADYVNPVTTVQYRHLSKAYPGRGIWAVGTLGKISYHMPLTDVKKISTEVPSAFILHQNYPNPFNPATKIRYEIAKTSDVRLSVFDILGKEITVLANEKHEPGTYEVTFDGSKLSGGVYFCKLESGSFTGIKKLLMVK